MLSRFSRVTKSSLIRNRFIQFRTKYSDIILEHCKNPQNVGSMDKNDKNVGTGLVGAPACGDVMKLQIRIENGKIVDTCFKTFGCASAIASSSYATEYIKGKTVDEARELTNRTIATELNLPPVKLHCSMLCEDAVKKALEDWENKQIIS